MDAISAGHEKREPLEAIDYNVLTGASEKPMRNHRRRCRVAAVAIPRNGSEPVGTCTLLSRLKAGGFAL